MFPFLYICLEIKGLESKLPDDISDSFSHYSVLSENTSSLNDVNNLISALLTMGERPQVLISCLNICKYQSDFLKFVGNKKSRYLTQAEPKLARVHYCTRASNQRVPTLLSFFCRRGDKLNLDQWLVWKHCDTRKAWFSWKKKTSFIVSQVTTIFSVCGNLGL